MSIAKFELRNELAVELQKTNNFGYILDNFRLWPVFEKLMLRHGRTISVQANVNPNKFKAFGKDVTFTQAQWQSIGLTYVELAFDVKQSCFKQLGLADNVADDDFSIGIVVNEKT